MVSGIYHNTNRMLQWARTVAVSIGVAVVPVAHMAAADIEAQLDRDTVVVGNGALLTVRISGGRAGQPAIPAVENLIIQPRGQSQNFQSINGQTTVSVTYSYAVGANVPGDYQIPAIDVMVGGQKLTSQSLTLKVVAAAVAQPPAGLGAASALADELGVKRFGFLTVELAANDRKHAYVGEIAPVRIQAWLPDGARVQLRSGIQPGGRAFTLHNVSSQPQQSIENKDGKRYTVVTWYGGISATKAGKSPVSLSLDVTVAVRDKSVQPSRRRRGGPFDDPFFDTLFDDMNAPMIQKDVTLKSDDQQIEVRPLPPVGRPAGFTGAVGDFKIESVGMPTQWTTGEPQSISARLSGSGNFALLNAPDITPPEGWQIYPNKGEFTAGDEASFSGSKKFLMSAVPRTGGPREAALEVSFFDPNLGAYKTVTSPVQKIQVAGADIVTATPTTESPAKEPEPPRARLIAPHWALTRRGSLVPLVERPAFAYLLGMAAVLAGIGGLGRWLRPRLNDPQRRARRAMEHSTREALQAADRCVAAYDAVGFFAAARSVLQQRLGWMWNQPPEAITLTEVQGRLAADSPVVRWFREADQHAYSQQPVGAIDPQWRTLLDEALADLTQSIR